MKHHNIKVVRYIVIVIVFLQFGCKPSQQNDGLPLCVTSKIDTIKKKSLQNPPAEVWKWEDEETVYYYFNAACCDQFSMLYNDNCDIICAPDGGFTGRGDQKCPEFDTDLKKTLVWKDVRKGS